MVAEALARTGVGSFVLVDHDRIETRNLDRTAGASRLDVLLRVRKTSIAARNIRRSGTAPGVTVETVNQPVQADQAINRILDCDVVFCCVDHHLPRYLLDFLANSHLVPVVDGGIGIDLPTSLKPALDISWRIHTATPGRPCLSCLKAYEYSRMGLERDELVDKPSYINNVPDLKLAYSARQNVYCFSMSCAAHEVLQFLGYALDNPYVSPATPQMYHAQSGMMFGAPFAEGGRCAGDCQMNQHVAKSVDLKSLFS